jgi:hypothetical protein
MDRNVEGMWQDGLIKELKLCSFFSSILILPDTKKSYFCSPFQKNWLGDSPLAQLVRVPHMRD